MPGTKASFQKRKATMIKKYGSMEAYEAKMREWSRKGGKKSPGFKAMSPERRKEIAKLGQKAARMALIKKYGLEFEAMPESVQVNPDNVLED